MFRASDIFGRKAGAAVKRPVVESKAVPEPREPPRKIDGPSNKVWDPATGEYIEEEIPAEVQELMGIRKKAKVEPASEGSSSASAWATRRQGGVLSAKTVGVPTKAPSVSELAMGGKVDTSMPSVEYKGFSKVELNDRYYERSAVNVHGRPTYWTEDGQFFIYWQGAAERWSICDAASFKAVRAGQLPGWAYKGDHRHLCQANGWMEAWEGAWREPELEVIFRSSAQNKPVWEDSLVQKSISTVEFSGFSMKELNGRYHIRQGEVVQGEPTYWDTSGVYFIYWQQSMRRWAICDLKCLEAVREGKCPGWAFRADSGFFANACGWRETRGGQWVDAIVETAVTGTSTKGLKVEFGGFSKKELNTQYLEKPDEEIQGRASFWDSTETYFIYWQSSMKRWAICDSLSLKTAKSGLSPGWAYRTDSQHFAKSSGWQEAWGRDWRPVTVCCTVLEGTVKHDSAFIKAEPSDSFGTLLSKEQYQTLVRKVYEEKNPSKLVDLPHLFVKYQGREHELFSQVCTKYEADAEALAAGLPASEDSIGAEAPDARGDAEQDEFSQLDEAPAPDLTAREYAILIQSAYERHNPAKLQDLARLLQKWRHKEKELYLLVCDKYGIHAAKFYAQHAKEKAAESEQHSLAAPV